jgi:hypothetical protein
MVEVTQDQFFAAVSGSGPWIIGPSAKNPYITFWRDYKSRVVVGAAQDHINTTKYYLPKKSA